MPKPEVAADLPRRGDLESGFLKSVASAQEARHRLKTESTSTSQQESVSSAEKSKQDAVDADEQQKDRKTVLKLLLE